jgi:hypothetical protein
MSSLAELKKPMRALCGYKKRNGKPCGALRIKGQPHCKIHNKGALRPAKHGLYHHLVDSSMQQIYAEVEAQGKISELSRPDLEEELKIARVQLIALLKNPNASAGIRLKAMETIQRIAKTAKIMKEIDASALRQEFLDSLLNAVSFAWHRANSISDPADRTRTFVSELAMWFPALNNDNVIQGEAILLEGPEDGEEEAI